MKSVKVIHNGPITFRTALYRIFILPQLDHLRNPQYQQVRTAVFNAAQSSGSQNGRRRAVPQLTRLTPLLMNREIQHSHATVLFKSSSNAAPQPRYTKDVLKELLASNASITGTDLEEFLVQISTPLPNSGALPLCALITRKELRKRKEKNEKDDKARAKREKAGKELDINWTIGDRDLDIILSKLEDFLRRRIKVSFSIVQPKRAAAVSQERMQEVYEKVVEAGRKYLKSKDTMSQDGAFGRMMLLTFRPGGGVEGGRLDGKSFNLQMPLSTVMLDAKMMDMKAALKKGIGVKLTLIPEEVASASKKWLTAEEIFGRVRTVARSVKNVVEDNTDNEPNVLSFMAEYKAKKLPRIIELNPDLSLRMLDVRGQWVAEWLDEDVPVCLFIPQATNIPASDSRMKRLADIAAEVTSKSLITKAVKKTHDVPSRQDETGVWIELSLGEVAETVRTKSFRPPQPDRTRAQRPVNRTLYPEAQRRPQNQESTRRDISDAMSRLMDSIK